MTEVRHILCPVDFSEVSLLALGHAAALARRYRASVLALHVVPFAPVPPAPMTPGATSPIGSPFPPPELRRALLEELDRAADSVRRSGVGVETIVREGDTTHAILSEAERLPIDLVVMGSHGRTGFRRLLLGSVAEAVVRRAPCPVLTVTPQASEPALRSFRYSRILCPIDFSDLSLQALEYAMLVAEDASVEVLLLHVREGGPYPFLPPESERGRREREGEAIEAQLYSLLPGNAGDVCTPRALVRWGRPAEEILNTAQEHAADIVVIGVHGRGALQRLAFGSVTSEVVRSASCPVLTVRPQAPRAASTRQPNAGL
jgi:nucleotide-binding universal stress UspA family protein